MEITLQEIFVVSFSIFFAIMLQSTMPLAPFKTSTASTHFRIFGRLLSSVLILNAFPVIYFAYFFDELQGLRFSKFSSLWQPFDYVIPILVVFSLSLGVYGFARLWYFLVVSKKNLFYTYEELNYVIPVEQRCSTFRRHWSQQIFPFFYYVLVPVSFFYLIKNGLDLYTFVSFVSLFIIIFVGFFVRYMAKSKNLLTGK